MARLLLRVPFKYCYSNKTFHVCFSSQVDYIIENQIAKIVNVAIIGAPNSGKSTLINNIVQRKICASSSKVHTTTKMARAICFENDTQIVFLDTPGVVSETEKKKYNLPDSMIGACHKSLRCANVIGVVHDISNRHTKDGLHKDVLKILQTVENIPSFLIINKVDKLNSKRQLLSLIHNLTNGCIAGTPIPNAKRRPEKHITPSLGYSDFSDVFLVSALKGDGVEDIRQYLLSNAKPAALHYTPQTWTDQKPENLIVEAVRATFLNFLPQEIPYKLSTSLEYFDDSEQDNKIVCAVVVDCPSERLIKLICGAGDGRLNQIKSSIRDDLIDMFQKPVVIQLRFKVPPKGLNK